MVKFANGKYKMVLDDIIDIEINLSASEARSLSRVLPVIQKDKHSLDLISEMDRREVYRSRK